MGVAEVEIPCYKSGVDCDDQASRYVVYLARKGKSRKGFVTRMHTIAAFLLFTTTVPTALMVHLDLVAVERRVYTVSRCS